MVLRVRWPNQQCHSTEGRWLVNHVKGQSHQARSRTDSHWIKRQRHMDQINGKTQTLIFPELIYRNMSDVTTHAERQTDKNKFMPRQSRASF